MMQATGQRVIDWLGRALREPLVHFLLAGAALFALFALGGGQNDPASRKSTITTAQVEALAANWAQTFRRPPSPQEVDGLIRSGIKEEIYVREALRLGLDQDDPVIRQRLRRKMELLARAQAEAAAPSDAQLQAWLDARPQQYARGEGLRFDQLYLAGQPDDPAVLGRAAALTALLARGERWQDLGDPLSVPPAMEGADQSAIARHFGEGFAAALAAMAPGPGWHPVLSGYGLHLVRLRAKIDGAPAALADVRQQVENDWRADTLQKREAAAYQALLDGYEIRIEKP